MSEKTPSYFSIDEAGKCHMLIVPRNGKPIECKEETIGIWAHYCLQHYRSWQETLEDSEKEREKHFPPTNEEGKPTRWAHYEENNEYKKLDKKNDSKVIGKNESLFVGNVRSNPNWKDKLNDEFWVYLIRCNDGALYVGQARGDPTVRIDDHRKGGSKAAKWVKEHEGVSEEIYKIMTVNRQVALEFEKALFIMLRSSGMRISMGSSIDD